MSTDDNVAAVAGLQVEPAEFVVGGSPAGQIDVRISYAIIDRFSEGLYSSSNKACEELISNSHDAGAGRVNEAPLRRGLRRLKGPNSA